jgi:hypothetical protein
MLAHRLIQRRKQASILFEDAVLVHASCVVVFVFHLLLSPTSSAGRLPPAPPHRLWELRKQVSFLSTLPHKNIAFTVFDLIDLRYQIAGLPISNHHEGFRILNTQVNADVSDDINYILILVAVSMQASFKALATFFDCDYEFDERLLLMHGFFIFHLVFHHHFSIRWRHWG